MNLPYPLRGFVAAWYAKDFYAAAALRRRGAGFVYLLVVLAVLQLVSVFLLAAAFDAWLRREAPAYANQVPRLTIDHGVLTTAAPMPSSIRDPRTGRELVRIDPDASPAAVSAAGPGLLVTRTQLVLRRNALETRIVSLAMFRHVEVGPPQAMRFLRLLAFWTPPIAWVLLVLAALVWNEWVALALALAGLALARARGWPLDLAALMRRAVVALTPVLILDTLFHALHWTMPLWWLLSLLLAFGYLVLGASAAAREVAGASGVAGTAGTGPVAAPPVRETALPGASAVRPELGGDNRAT